MGLPCCTYMISSDPVINNMQLPKEHSHGHMQLHAPSYNYLILIVHTQLWKHFWPVCSQILRGIFLTICLRSWLILLHTYVLQYLSFVHVYFQAPISQCATLETWECGLGRCYRPYITCVVLQYRGREGGRLGRGGKGDYMWSCMRCGSINYSI